ncbi:hypothetical protein HID58_034852, partial [Brassica napus]
MILAKKRVIRSQLTLGIYPIENFSMSSACGKYQVY